MAALLARLHQQLHQHQQQQQQQQRRRCHDYLMTLKPRCWSSFTVLQLLIIFIGKQMQKKTRIWWQAGWRMPPAEHSYTHAHTYADGRTAGKRNASGRIYWMGRCIKQSGVTVSKVKLKSKRIIAVSDSPHRYGNSHAIWDHTVLPATLHGRGDIPAVTPTEAGTRLSDPGGMQC